MILTVVIVKFAVPWSAWSKSRCISWVDLSYFSNTNKIFERHNICFIIPTEVRHACCLPNFERIEWKLMKWWRFEEQNLVIFSCDQAALQMVFSVCPSVRLSVCLSHLFDYVPIIVSSWHFQELLPLTKVRSMQKAKVRGQRSRSQRSQPNLTVSGL